MTTTETPHSRIRRLVNSELDMTPLVDVTFLLLIFFMITASFDLQKSIESPRQQTAAPGPTPIDPPPEVAQVTVQIDEAGAFLVLANEWERETPSKQNLISGLKAAQADGASRLSIEVHQQANLQALVDCMDAGTLAQYQDVRITEVDGFHL